MKSIFKWRVTVVAYFFIMLFSYASVQKLFDFKNFRFQLKVAPQLGAYGEMVAYLIVILQILIVILLCWNKSWFFGFSITVLMLGTFSIYMGMILLQKSQPCECLGILKGLDWKQNLFLTLIFLVVGAFGLDGSTQETTKR